MTTTFHITRLGAYAAGVPTDRDGYVHLTAQGWLESPDGREVLEQALRDTPDDPEEAEDYAQDWAEEQAAAARVATERAEEGI